MHIYIYIVPIGAVGSLVILLESRKIAREKRRLKKDVLLI
jgi:hypothetical protein